MVKANDLRSNKNITNETINTIYQRRAVRKYKDESIERNIIEQILDAGRMAPSAINNQPWKFYILTSKKDIKAFSKEITKAAVTEIAKLCIKGVIKTASDLLHFSQGADVLKMQDPIFHSAPVVIFITSSRNNEWAGLDIGMCSQNIMLAAKSLGLDTCPVGLGKFVEQTELYSTMNVPKSEQVNLAIILGYGDESREPEEVMKNNAVFL
jgi:nitroreductase